MGRAVHLGKGKHSEIFKKEGPRQNARSGGADKVFRCKGQGGDLGGGCGKKNGG